MQAVTHPYALADLASDFRGMSAVPSSNIFATGQGGLDAAQLQHLVQLLGSKQQHQHQQAQQQAMPAQMPLPPPPPALKQTAIVECPKSMVGRVIGKGGETIKALQQYTGAMIQIDQSTDPTRVTIAGSPHSLQLAVSMVHDIVRGTFKGFAMLRQIAIATSAQAMGQFGQPQPVYVQGYGFVPPSQVFSPEESLGAASAMRTSPTGPLTPPMSPLRASTPGMLTDQLAALLGAQARGQHQQQLAPAAGSSQEDALIAQLLSQLSMQQGAPPTAPPPPQLSSGLEQGAIQTLLAQAGLMGTGQAAASANATPGLAQVLPPGSAPSLPPSTSLMLSAQGTPAVLGGGGGSGGGSGAQFGGLAGAVTPPGPRSTGAASPAGSGSGGLGAPPQPGAGYAASFLHSIPAAAGPGLLFATSPRGSGSEGGSGSGRTSPPFPGLASAANAGALSSRRPASGESSPLGRFGAIGTGIAGSAAGGGAAEEALKSRLGQIAAASSEAGGARGGSREGSPLRQHAGSC